MNILKNPTIYLMLASSIICGIMMSKAIAKPSGGVAVEKGNPYVNSNGYGQVLIFPYYTVRGGQKSLFNITNTSDATVAVKVRFHEGQNSRDAFDFNIILSPHDVWAGYIEDSATGPVIKSGDNSCIIGAPKIHNIGQSLSTVAYSDMIPIFTDQGFNSIDRTREGYVVVIAMGQAPAGEEDTLSLFAPFDPLNPVAYYAKHVDGVPRNCSKVRAAFNAPVSAPQTLPVAFPFEDNGPLITDPLGDGDPTARLMFESFATGENPLKGNFSVINADTGIGAGNAAVAIADFMNPAVLSTATKGINLITAQNFPYFLEPTLASRDGIWTITGLTDIDVALTSIGITNEWAQNTSTGAVTDWVITFPTKSFHVDNENANGIKSSQNIQASSNQWRTGVTDTQIPSAPFKDNIDHQGAAIDISLVVYNRQEQLGVVALGSEALYGPPYRYPLTLRGDINLLTFSRSTSSAFRGENFLLNFNTSNINKAPNGWAELTFDGNSLPAVGFAYKVRNQGDATLNFGQIIGHGWR